jgi:glucose-6-phosphate isomerase
LVDALKEISNKNDFETFVIPDNIGGRYSVFTPVGLVPLLFAGIDIKQLLNGAIKAEKDFPDKSLFNKNVKPVIGTITHSPLPLPQSALQVCYLQLGRKACTCGK